jgi:transcriptional regulator with XRE-family HTH domain
MTAPEYKLLRQSVGTQQSVADALGVSITTVQRREAGEIPVTQEAAIAILSVAGRDKCSDSQVSSLDRR